MDKKSEKKIKVVWCLELIVQWGSTYVPGCVWYPLNISITTCGFCRIQVCNEIDILSEEFDLL